MYLAEELLERIRADDVRVGFETRFTKGFLQEFGHFETNTEEFPTLLFLYYILVVSMANSSYGTEIDLRPHTCPQTWTEAYWGKV